MLAIPGCTAVGFGLGAVVDVVARGGMPGALANARPGTQVTMTLQDGSRVSGRFSALREPSTETYANRVVEWRASHPELPGYPAPGTRVTLRGSPASDSGAFRGLSPAGVRLQDANDVALRIVPFANFSTMAGANGWSMTTKGLQGIVMEGTMPTGTIVELAGSATGGTEAVDVRGARVKHVAWDDIAEVQVSAPRTGKWLFTLAGLAADVWIAVAILSQPLL